MPWPSADGREQRFATAALASFFAGTVATVALAVAGPVLSRFALSFGPAEYVALTVFVCCWRRPSWPADR